MEKYRIFGGRLEAVPFFRDDVEERRTIQVLHHLQIFAKQADVVAVDRAEIAHPKLFKQHPAVQACFDAFLELGQKSLDWITEQRHAIQNANDFMLETGI